MRAGRLSQRVQLQSATESRDAHGEPIKTWSTVDTVWAGVEPIRGDEGVQARQVAETNVVRIVMRYRSDVAMTWRIVHGTHTYQIVGLVDPNNRHVSLELTGQELL